jgi:hypothetical protein
MATVLQGANIEAARAALRSLIGSIPVFEDAGQLYGRIGLNPTPLFQPRNPQTFGGVVAGAGFELGATHMPKEPILRRNCSRTVPAKVQCCFRGDAFTDGRPSIGRGVTTGRDSIQATISASSHRTVFGPVRRRLGNAELSSY